MSTIMQDAYRDYQTKKLTEARVELLKRGVYPFNIFLKEHSEVIAAARKIEQLEEVIQSFKAQVPLLHMFIQQNTMTLLESRFFQNNIKAVMINYAFISESVGTCIQEVARIFADKYPNQKQLSLRDMYKNEAVQLLEFCIQKARAYKFMEGNPDAVVAEMAIELASMPINSLMKLAESIPRIPLYVSNGLYDDLVQTILLENG